MSVLGLDSNITLRLQEFPRELIEAKGYIWLYISLFQNENGFSKYNDILAEHATWH